MDIWTPLSIDSVNNLRNDLIANGRYTDGVDDVIVKFSSEKLNGYLEDIQEQANNMQDKLIK